ncbi:hypothetical protein DH96_02020 [Candidatus Phytoplasma oryzae]|uniref:Uncharacterized protein n=1 Tax=Candidatus Phytoplasma oryzae TaxID=203274 RepID=A0A328IK71_9MOLU|nr:hypothetical protein [Candidatus Phytoplasma oryzae]RAM57700.1 hypothetical protein DH96_02020 [Candidatus Phytoplasma oryzae]
MNIESFKELYQDLKILKIKFQKAEEIINENFIKTQEVLVFIENYHNNTSHDESFLRVKKFFKDKLGEDIFFNSLKNFIQLYKNFKEEAQFNYIICKLQQAIDIFQNHEPS